MLFVFLVKMFMSSINGRVFVRRLLVEGLILRLTLDIAVYIKLS